METEIFGRTNQNGNIDILWAESGEAVTRLGEASATVYPVDSSLSAHYEHPMGIEVTPQDAKKIGIEIEQHQRIDERASWGGLSSDQAQRSH